MQVGQRAVVTKLDRESPEERERWVEQEGLLVRRLNVPWEPGLGALWQLRFDSGEDVVFSESELAVIGPDGRATPPDMDELRDSWGDAPRTISIPFKRFGGGAGNAPALLAFVIFVVAGVLLLWAGISSESLPIAGAGGALLLIALGAVAVLVA